MENVFENDSEGFRNIFVFVNKYNEEVDYVLRNEVVERGEKRDDSDELLYKELGEFAVKEVFYVMLVENDRKDILLDEGK